MQHLQQRRTVWLGLRLIILSLAVGGGLGLLLSRVIALQQFTTASIADLGVHEKEEFIVLVAAAYARDGDLDRARARLEALESPNVGQWLANLTDRHVSAGQNEAEIRALVALAQGLGADTAPMVAWLQTMASPTPAPTDAPRPTATPNPTATPLPTASPTASPLPPTETLTPPPADTPVPPTDTPLPPAPTAQPSATPPPPPTRTPAPTAPPAPAWTWTARLVGPGQEGQECDGGGKKMVRVTVLDANGEQIPGVWIYERYTDQYRVTGHKGDDPFWGHGEAEYSGLEGAQVCIATGEGGACASDFTRNLPCHDSVPVDDLWAAGYCECWEPGITKEQCRENIESGYWLKIGWYYWRVEFRRSK